MASSHRRLRWVFSVGAIALMMVPLVSCSKTARSDSSSALNFPIEEESEEEDNPKKNQNKKNQNSGEALDPLSVQPPPPPPAGAYLGGVSPAVFSQLKYLPLLAPAYIPEGFVLVKHDVPNAGYSLVYRSEVDQCFAIEYASAEDSANAETSSTNSPSDLPPFAVPLPETLDFKAFDSPVFGMSQKLFYGKAAQVIAAEELALKTSETTSETVSKAASEETFTTETSTATTPPATTAATPQSITEQLSEKTTDTAGRDSLVSQWLQNDQGFYRYLTGAIVTQNYPEQMPCTNVSLEESVKIVTSLTDLTAETSDSITELLPPPAGHENASQTSGN